MGDINMVHQEGYVKLLFGLYRFPAVYTLWFLRDLYVFFLLAPVFYAVSVEIPFVGLVVFWALWNYMMTITTTGDEAIVEQILKQLRKLVTTLKVVDLTGVKSVEREMMLLRVDAEGSKRAEVLRIVDIFRCKVVDVSPDELILEVTGTQDKLTALISLLQRFGIKDVARTGAVALRRGMAVGVGFEVEDKKDKSVEIVHLGPKDFVDLASIGLKVGDEVKVIGAWAELDTQDVLMAVKVKKGEDVQLKVRRTRDGFPYWSMTPEERQREMAGD